MSIVFFVSSLGDTDLAKATIAKILINKTKDPIYLVPVTTTAEDRCKDLSEIPGIMLRSLVLITKQADISSHKQISATACGAVSQFINENNIQHAYIGVPSPVDEEIPFQIALAINIPCTIVNEFMFSPPEAHRFWHYLDAMVAKPNCEFAVPLADAINDIVSRAKNAVVHSIGHLCIDRALMETKNDTEVTHQRDQWVFISGTTQPVDVDREFVSAILTELASQQYPHIKIHMGIHPGIKDVDHYLKELLIVCAKYPGLEGQFKIILTVALNARLRQQIESDFILHENVSGAVAAARANKVAQAVPGALLNEAALIGKPAYFHNKNSKPYLPENYFSKGISDFFGQKRQAVRSLSELKLTDSAPNNLSNLLIKRGFV